MSFLWHGLTEQGAQVPVQVDAQGRVIAVDGTPGVSNWERTGTTLSPAIAGDAIKQGSYDSSSDSGVGAYIGSGSIIGQQALGASSTAPVFQVRRGSGDPTINLRSAGEADFASDVKIIGTGTLAAPNISLNASGSATFTDTLSTEAGIRAKGANSSIKVRQDDNATLSFAVTQGGTADADATIRFNGSGSAKFAGTVICGGNPYIGGEVGSALSTSGYIHAAATSGSSPVFYGYLLGKTTPNATILADGSAAFAGNITAPNVTFRSADPQFYVKKSKNKDALPEYVGPELDLLAEIARLEALVRHLYEKLRITPPAGWPVWDGNDEVLRQLQR